MQQKIPHELENIQDREQYIQLLQSGLRRAEELAERYQTGQQELEELSRETACIIRHQRGQIRAAEKMLMTLPSPGREIMELHFLDGLTWDAIGWEVNYSRESIFRWRRKMIKLLASGSHAAKNKKLEVD